MALKYSGAREGRPLPTVLEMVVGPVDRGACIQDLSQYPDEIEYLYLPMSFISPDGTPRFTISAAGLGVRVIPVRVNVNLSACTVEELLGQKKRIHCTAFLWVLKQLKCDLAELAEKGNVTASFDCNSSISVTDAAEGLLKEMISGIAGQFEAVLKEHEAKEEWEYADNSVFQGLVTGMLDAQRWAVSKLRLWLEDCTTYRRRVADYSLRKAHRHLTAYLVCAMTSADTKERRQNAALEVCKVRGLLRSRVDEANNDGEPPLVAAAADGAAAADIRMLIAAGCDVNCAGGASRAVMMAAMFGRDDALCALLDARADINASAKVVHEGLYC